MGLFGLAAFAASLSLLNALVVCCESDQGSNGAVFSPRAANAGRPVYRPRWMLTRPSVIRCNAKSTEADRSRSVYRIARIA